MTNYENLFFCLRNEVDKTHLFKYVNIFGNDIFNDPNNLYMCIGTTTPVDLRRCLIAKQIGDCNLHYEFRIVKKNLFTMVHFENKFGVIKNNSGFAVNNSLCGEIENYCGNVVALTRYINKKNAYFYYIADSQISLNNLVNETDQVKINNIIDQIVTKAISNLIELDKKFRGV